MLNFDWNVSKIEVLSRLIVLLGSLQVVVALKLYVYVMVTFLKKETVNPVAQFSSKSFKCHSSNLDS